MSKTTYIYIETSSLLEGISGIARWVEVINQTLARSKFNVKMIDRSMFGLRNNILCNLLYYNLLLPIYLKFMGRGLTVLIVPNNVSKFFFRPTKNTIYFVHDLIPLDSRAGYRGIRRFVYLFKLRQLKKAIAILTTTQFVAKQIDEIVKAKSNIYPVYGFIDNRFSPEQGAWKREYSLPVRYILAVGTGEYRKNLDLILDTYALDFDKSELPPLVLFGNSWQGIGHKLINEKVASLGISDRVHLLGSVTDEELCYLYTNCDVFIYPSIAEGFGLPPIEALACGSRVIVSDLPVFREVLGESAVFVDSKCPHVLLRTILKSVDYPTNCISSIRAKFSQEAASDRINEFLTILDRSLADES